MKLQSIRLRNYRCHEDLTVEFNDQFNAIAAVNGGGKTSLLRGIADGLPWFINALGIEHNYWPWNQDSRDVVRTTQTSFEGRYRHESFYPVTIDVAVDVGDRAAISWAVIKTGELAGPTTDGDDAYTLWQFDQRDVRKDAGGNASCMPLFAFYRASRQWPVVHTSELHAAADRNARADAYASWHDASLDTAALQRWMIAKSLERLETSVEKHLGFDETIDDDLAAINASINRVLSDAKGLRYDMKRKAVLVEWSAPDRDPTAFEHLSDGQRAIICLVADIARRACLANPMLGVDAPSQTPGIILIDELDVHLHPHWQRLITRGLKAAFPALQFIVATHSPQVLGELQPEEIILLSRGTTTHPQVSYGLSSAQVLEIIMETDERTPAVEHTLDDIFEMLERSELAAAGDAIATLEQKAAGLPELEQARAVLRRKELIGI